MSVPARRPRITLQNLAVPRLDLCSETALYFRLRGPCGYDQDERALHLAPGGRIVLDTYFNAFSLEKWRTACTLRDLAVEVEGTGRVALRLRSAGPGGGTGTLASRVLDLDGGAALPVDPAREGGILYLDVRALGAARITGVRITAARPRREMPRLALSITTFRREDEVARKAADLARFIAASEFGENLHLFVVDNGDSAAIEEGPRVTRLPNANLGGAGGFARGLLEAEAGGFSHVLFMDDDAAADPEAVHRTYAFLALARDPATAVAGAMIDEAHPWRMWENGAVFDRRCRPLQGGADLRDANEVAGIEAGSLHGLPEKGYGGWWHFAFPVAHVRRYPFPFFVRGDDVSFSLVNAFRIYTLNGVVTFGSGFTERESPLTWYLDLRSHMVHHLALEGMEIGPGRIARIALWFMLRNAVRFQYATMEVLLLAWDDVMRGPGFFVEHADMGRRRARIRELAADETPRPLAAIDLTERHRVRGGGGPFNWRAHLFRNTLNGHLLPVPDGFGNRVVLTLAERDRYARMWGASEIVFTDAAGTTGYAMRRSRRRFWRLMRAFLAHRRRFVRDYAALRDAYRARYPEIAAPGFWRTALKVDPGSRCAQPGAGPGCEPKAGPGAEPKAQAGSQAGPEAGRGAPAAADARPARARPEQTDRASLVAAPHAPYDRP